jgi:hypothetical protein
MRQRERRPGRKLLDNSKPALGQRSKAVGYRRKWEELLMLRDPGSDGRSGGGESVGHSGVNKDGHRGPCISCLKYNSAEPRAQRHPHVLAPSHHATHVEHRTSSRILDAVPTPTPTASPLALLLRVLRLNPPQLSPGTPHHQVMRPERPFHPSPPPSPYLLVFGPYGRRSRSTPQNEMPPRDDGLEETRIEIGC